MQLRASDIIDFNRPTPCGLRMYLRQHGVRAAEPSEFDNVLAVLGERHEKAHLAGVGEYMDLSEVAFEEAIEITRKAVNERTGVIYQAALAAEQKMETDIVSIIGRPDFLIVDGSGYTIRDSKLSRQVDEDHHQEIAKQLQLYGWLFEKTFGERPKRLEVHTGKGDIAEVQYDNGTAALAELATILDYRLRQTKPYDPVGWSKCSGCGFGELCLREAEELKDVAILPEVDQNLARALHDVGTTSYVDLRKNFDSVTLSEFKRPWGNRIQKVGKKAERILLYADVMEDKKEKLLAPPAIPPVENYVMFDLEGLPPQLDELEKIYLWGLQVYGSKPSVFTAATARFGVNGDKQGWVEFLENAATILDEYGDIPFVHWHHYERVNIDKYIGRYGDIDGIAVRVKANLLDLLPITKNSIALPLPSYSLKIVEQYVGFKRTQDAYGGDWAMAKFIEATETSDGEKRDALMAQILKYNEEDLAATWAVLQWLRTFIPVPASSTP